MDKTDIIFGAFVLCAVILLIGMLASQYYPNNTEQITIEKSVSSEHQCGIVTTTGEYYNINFETYARIEEGNTYVGIVTQPLFSGKYIDHLKMVDIESEER